MTHLASFIFSVRFLVGYLVGAVISWLLFSLLCGAQAGDSDKPFRQ